MCVLMADFFGGVNEFIFYLYMIGFTISTLIPNAPIIL